MKHKGKAEKMTVVAELSVESSLGVEQVKSFDKAWQRSLELPLPVKVRFVGFVRL